MNICSKCGEVKEIIVIGLPAEGSDEEVKYFCKQCAEEEGYIRPYKTSVASDKGGKK